MSYKTNSVISTLFKKTDKNQISRRVLGSSTTVRSSSAQTPAPCGNAQLAMMVGGQYNSPVLFLLRTLLRIDEVPAKAYYAP